MVKAVVHSKVLILLCCSYCVLWFCAGCLFCGVVSGVIFVILLRKREMVA